jgi:hypothetical protein
VRACLPSYAGSINRRITVQTHLGIKGDSISKINKVKKAGMGLKW